MMAAMDAISAKVDEIRQASQTALNANTSLAYQNVDALVRELEAMAREAIQATLRDRYQSLLKKLKEGIRLTAEEVKMVELLIVGEAKYYLMHENDLENWQHEVNRLATEMKTVDQGGLDDIGSLFHLQALCRDARNVLPDLAFYFREKERLERFKLSSGAALDKEGREILAEVIEGMMTSSKM